MRRFLYLLIAWLGIAAPVFAANTCDGVYDTQANATAAAASAAGGFQDVDNGPAGPYDINNGNWAVQLCATSHAWAFHRSNGDWHIFGYNGTSGCVSPKVANPSTGLCEDPPPPECATGQTWSGTACVPDTPAPQPGDSASEAAVEIGTVDAAGNVTHNASWDLILSGGTLTYNCGGWECTVAAVNLNETGLGGVGCGAPTGGGAAACSFIPIYTGNVAQVSTATVPNVGGSGNVTLPVVGCPAGYTLNSAGACVIGGTAGTASTATTPGTAGTSGTSACPTGFTANASGICTGTATPTIDGGSGCPAGYTKDANNICTATATLGSPSEVTDAVAIGGINKDPMDAAIAGNKGLIDALGAKTCSITGTCPGSEGGLLSWAWRPVMPVGGCSDPSMTMFGRTMTYTGWCDKAGMVAELFGFVLSIYGALALFSIATGRRAGA